MSDNKKKYDLKDRTFLFSKNLVAFLGKNTNKTLHSIITQCIRSGTSIGANYWEADCAQSRKDFIHKLSICKKEAQETEYWLLLLKEQNDSDKQILGILLQEVIELKHIFISIVSKTKLQSNTE